MKKMMSIIVVLFLITVTFTGCAKKNAYDESIELCKEACENMGGASKTQCESACEKAADQYAQQEEIDYEAMDTMGGAEPNDDGFDDEMETAGVGGYEESSGDWPSNMPDEVPMFTYGDVTGSEYGLDSWVVDFENVPDTAMADYVDDLKAEGWSASSMEMTGMLTGSHPSGYTITGNFDRDYDVAQLIVRE